jgi:hypothetical protein
MPFDRISGPGSSPASIAPRTASASPPISQAELEAFRELKDRLDQLQKRYVRRRLGIIQRVADGAPVQPGRLRPLVSTFTQRRLSASRLAEVLGETEVAELKNLVVPTIQTQLRIIEES